MTSKCHFSLKKQTGILGFQAGVGSKQNNLGTTHNESKKTMEVYTDYVKGTMLGTYKDQEV